MGPPFREVGVLTDRARTRAEMASHEGVSPPKPFLKSNCVCSPLAHGRHAKKEKTLGITPQGGLKSRKSVGYYSLETNTIAPLIVADMSCIIIGSALIDS